MLQVTRGISATVSLSALIVAVRDNHGNTRGMQIATGNGNVIIGDKYC